MRTKMTLALGGAATLVWLCGSLLTGPAAHAQTTTDQTDQTTKTKKKKKSAKSTEAPSATATEAPSAAATAPAETGKKPKKSKKSATEVPSQSFVPPGTAGEPAAPVKNATPAQVQSAKSSGMVWVNTDSGIYHKGDRWYGNTKQGKFMTEQEAVQAGYKAAQNEK